MSAAIHIDRDTTDTPTDQSFASWVNAVLRHRAVEIPKDVTPELSIRCVNREEMTEANQRYRDKSGATNVLSFPVEPELTQKTGLLGDILICTPVVAEEAGLQGKELGHHWAHLTVHGALHLLGFDHIESDEAERMEALEIEILDSLTIPDPYALGD